MMLLPAMNTAATVGGHPDRSPLVGDQPIARSEQVEVTEGGDEHVGHSGTRNVDPLVLEAAAEVGQVNLSSGKDREGAEVLGDESLRETHRVDEIVVGKATENEGRVVAGDDARQGGPIRGVLDDEA